MNMGAKVLFSEEVPEDAYNLTVTPDLQGEYIVDTEESPLILREAPSTDSEQVAQMPKGATFCCYGFTDDTGLWLLGEYAREGIIYPGFAYKDYLMKKPINYYHYLNNLSTINHF